jgi:cofilin
MSSGGTVNPDCINKFQDLKLKKGYRYIIFQVTKDRKEVVVEKTSASGEYGDFLADLPEDAPRFAVYDFEHQADEGKRNKLVFVSWSPDGAKTKEQMLYSSFRDALKRALVGIGHEIQAGDSSEISHDAVLEKISKKK